MFNLYVCVGIYCDLKATVLGCAMFADDDLISSVQLFYLLSYQMLFLANLTYLCLSGNLA